MNFQFYGSKSKTTFLVKRFPGHKKCTEFDKKCSVSEKKKWNYIGTDKIFKEMKVVMKYKKKNSFYPIVN